MSNNLNSPGYSPQFGPLSIGNVISAGFRIYRDHFKLYLGLSFQSLLWFLIPIYGWAKSYKIQAIISRQVFKNLINQPETISQTWLETDHRFWGFWLAKIMIWFICIIFNIALSITSSIIVFALSLIISKTVQDSSISAIIISRLQLIFDFVTFLICIWFYCRFFIAEVSLVIEQKITATACISRSWLLTKGFVMKIQGIFVLTNLIIGIPTVILITLPIVRLWPGLQASSSDTVVHTLFLMFIWIFLLNVTVNTFFIPFWQAIKAVIYYDLRSRKEGMELQLSGPI